MTKTQARTLGRLVGKRVRELAIDATSWAIGLLCDRYPHIDERRQIHQLRMARYHDLSRIAELEEQVAGYKAMHELQHGQTVDLPLTETDEPVNHRDLN